MMATVIGESLRVKMHDGSQWVDIGAIDIQPVLYEGDPIYLKPITVTVKPDVDWIALDAFLRRALSLRFRWRPWVAKAALAAALLALTLVLAAI